MPDAVLLPGGGYDATAGMLMYAGAVPERRGATLHRHRWTFERTWPLTPAVEDQVCADAEALLDRVGGRPLLIGKSLGSMAARLAADRELPAIWLTPLLTVAPWVSAALSRATAPMLLVGGTGDESWDGDAARRMSPHVLEIEGADHGLEVPGPVAATVAALGRVVSTMDEFLDEIAWARS